MWSFFVYYFEEGKRMIEHLKQYVSSLSFRKTHAELWAGLIEENKDKHKSHPDSLWTSLMQTTTLSNFPKSVKVGLVYSSHLKATDADKGGL